MIPLCVDEKVFNDAEKEFYENCAAYVITGHFKIYAKALQKQRMRDFKNASRVCGYFRDDKS